MKYVLILTTLVGGPSANGFQNHTVTMHNFNSLPYCISAGLNAKVTVPMQVPTETPIVLWVEGNDVYMYTKYRFICLPVG